MAIPVRLLYGYLSQSSDPYNLSIPWRNSVTDGLFQMNYAIEDAITDNLKVWAKTNWGERPMKFQFGLDAKRALFEPMPIAKEIILNNARNQLSKYFGFLNIKELSVKTPDDDNSLNENSVIFTLVATFKDDENKQVKVSENIGL